MSIPERVRILADGARLTNGDRDKEYGPPLNNFSLSGKIKRLLREHTGRDIHPAEQEALDMVVTKLSRAVAGKPKRDTYVDGAAYFAIAGEIALSTDKD